MSDKAEEKTRAAVRSFAVDTHGRSSTVDVCARAVVKPQMNECLECGNQEAFVH